MSPDTAATVFHVFFMVFSFVMGITWGSFFNVCVYRVPVGKSIVRPGSHCYSCGTFLKWYDNIPLLSYVLLGGNCRYCGSHFSARYFLVELLSGVLFVLTYLQFGAGITMPLHWAFLGLLIVGTFTDIDHFIIPDGITIGGLIFALAAALLPAGSTVVSDEAVLARDIYLSFRDLPPAREAALHFPMPFLWACVSAGFGWAILAALGVIGRVLFRKEAMGVGDMKLFAFLGAYLGAVNCIWILFLSAILGSCVGLSLILVHKLLRREQYEEFELVPEQALAGKWAVPGSISADLHDRDTLMVGQTVMPAAESALPSDPAAPVSMRIARSTSRQLHHFPYGPYIAVAAVLVMFFHGALNRYTRDVLFVPFRGVSAAAIPGPVSPEASHVSGAIRGIRMEAGSLPGGIMQARLR